MIYRTNTEVLPGKELLFQLVFDNSDQSYYAILYKRSGFKIKHCETSFSEQGAMKNMYSFLEEMKKGEK